MTTYFHGMYKVIYLNLLLIATELTVFVSKNRSDVLPFHFSAVLFVDR